MLEYKDVIPHLHKWAIIYSKYYPQYEKDELINIAFLGTVLKLDNIKFASRRIRFDILDFIRRDLEKQRKHRCFLKEFRNSEQRFDVDYREQVEKIDSIDAIMSCCQLMPNERELIYLVFYKGKSQRAIGKIMNVSQATVHDKFKIVMEKLKTVGELLKKGD